MQGILKMKPKIWIGIYLFFLLLVPQKQVVAQGAENNDLTTIGQDTQPEGFDFNKGIQDIDGYFQDLGNGAGEGLRIIKRFDRNIGGYYNQYQRISNGDYLTGVCLLVNFVTGECEGSGEEYVSELALDFLESELGIGGDTVAFFGKFFDVDLINGRIRTKDLETIAGNLLGVDLRGQECLFVFRVVAGGCPGDTRLPVLVTRDIPSERDDNRASGDYRSLSQPTHLLLSENLLSESIDPNTNIHLANLYDREIARSVAFGFVEQRGQQWLGDNLLENYLLVDENIKIHQQIYNLAAESMNSSVTQDVMKLTALALERNSNMALNQSILASKNQASLLSLQQQTAYSMQIQANISDTLDRDIRTRQNQQEATIFRSITQPMYIPGYRYMYR